MTGRGELLYGLVALHCHFPFRSMIDGPVHVSPALIDLTRHEKQILLRWFQKHVGLVIDTRRDR